MDPNVIQDPILDSNERLVAIGLNSNGELDLPFLKEVAQKHPPVIKLFRRWCERENISAGNFQSVPGLQADGAMIRPSFYNLVVTTGTGDFSRPEWVKESLSGAFEEARVFGFERMALHVPSIMRGGSNPVESLREITTELDTFPPLYFYLS